MHGGDKTLKMLEELERVQELSEKKDCKSEPYLYHEKNTRRKRKRVVKKRKNIKLLKLKEEMRRYENLSKNGYSSIELDIAMRECKKQIDNISKHIAINYK